MTNSDIVTLVREEVKRQLSVILAGISGNASVSNEDIQQLYPSMPTITARPVMHPYGYASRAPDGKVSVTAKVGSDVTNQMVMGHRDSDRPTDLQSGESAIYSRDHMQVRVGNTQVFVGKTTDNTASGFAGQNFVGVDDATGNIILQHKSGATLQIDTNGSIVSVSKDGSMLFLNATNGEASLVSKDGNMVALKADGITISDKSGKQILSMDGSGEMDLLADQDIVISAGRVALQGGTINLGNNAVLSGVIAEMLMAYIDTQIIPAFANLGQVVTPTSVYNLNPALSFRSLYVKTRSNIV